MARQGLNPLRVAEEAEAMAEEEGWEQVTLAAVAARLGVRQPSLYKHVAGIAELRRQLAARARDELARELTGAVAGRSGEEALAALCRAYRDWALAHPGRYGLTVVAAEPGDAAGVAASEHLIEIVRAALTGFGLDGDAEVDAIRGLRAGLHGFVDLERRGGFGLPRSTDRSFDHLIETQSATLRRPAPRP